MARLAEAATVVPVHREILADGLTPVVAKATVGQGPGSFLLESVVGGEKWARFSFVGFDPSVIVRGVADRFERVYGPLASSLDTPPRVEREDGVDPWARLRETLAEWRPPRDVRPLPRFWGGAVGYVAYDAVRTFEPTVGEALTRDDDWEFCFGLGGTLLIFDNVRQTLRVVVPTRVAGPADAPRAYAAATGKDVGTLTTDPEVRALIQRGVDTANEAFARVEQIKRFAIVPRNFTIADNELTPTLKIKRRIILQNWAHLVEDLYADEDA